jgi:nucleotide-binding universal stress UspA family protein
MSTHRSSVVVVGVDGSTSSVAALQRAFAEARHRGGVVEIVTAWSCRGTTVSELRRTHAGHLWALQAQRTAFAMATEHRDDVPTSTAVIVGGDPAEVLARAAEGAACLVLGSSVGRSSGSAPHSVQTRCLATTDCPVIVVTERGRSTADATPR